ncbi:MAG TPA: YhfC family glutamic-type intramembrane protease [Ktedonobacteraceae bacterium]|nr:YhfC family glutamic-type intramembrane protease [Ktedonobacteraceae bacterium]
MSPLAVQITFMSASAIQVNPGFVASLAVAFIFSVGYPIILAIIAHRRLKVGWRYFGFGALIFFVFQMITRVPAVVILQNVFARQLQASATFRISWLVILALTAGLFEEVGRYVGYRFLMRREEKTWNKAVMYGIGHGGLESMLLVGGQQLLTLINILTLMYILNANPAALPAAQHAQVVRQFAALNAQPVWSPLLGAWERLWTLPVHIALSVIVLQVFRRNNLNWLWLAILAHAIVDFTAVIVVQILGASLGVSLLVEGIIAIFGLIALWIIWRLRDRGDNGQIAGSPAEPPASTAVAENPPVA